MSVRSLIRESEPLVRETNFGAIGLLLPGEVLEFAHQRGFRHPTTEHLKEKDLQPYALPFLCVTFGQEN
jgi:hypothetical protein